MRRNRFHYFLLLAGTVGLGLLSRSDFIPAWIYPYLGDVLYSCMLFFLIAFLFPRMPTMQVGLLSVGLCFLIEFSQLYQADWINTIRQYRLGGLVLGYGFLWSDLGSYVLGGMIGGLGEMFFPKGEVLKSEV